jgi:uncharacterized protein
MAIIDTDVHHTWRSIQELLPFLDEPWRFQVTKGFRATASGHGWNSPIGFEREDAMPPSGGRPASDPAFLAQQLYEPLGIAYAILNPASIISIATYPDGDYAAALCRAYNDWQLQSEWLDDARNYVAMVVAPQDAEAAAREIERVGEHPRVASVLLSSALGAPAGHRKFWPLYAAAERVGLPVSLHPGADGSGIAGPPTAVGWPRTYFEWHTDLSQGYMAHTVSLLADGVFQKFPNLKVVLTEGGFGWVPHVLWRADKNWKALRIQLPWLNEPPSAVFRRHIRLTTQPMEEPEKPGHLENLIDMMGSDELLMFSSDYPHWDGDDPRHSLRAIKSEALREKILYGNAHATFTRLPREGALP